MDNQKLIETLNAAITALDDWTNTYASDFCDEARVAEAWRRIKDNGGTIAYIADTLQLCKDARDSLNV